MTDILTLARDWAASDPDPETRSIIESLIAAGDTDTLESHFTPALGFGTAGIRGKVGAGPARMNRAVVIRTTYGLAGSLPQGTTVVLGFDARPSSQRFAEDVAGVLAASGFKVLYWPEPTPTPLVAYAARYHGAAAAVVITASHNPPEDNGYKVYASNAAQIIPPVDVDIEARIRTAPPASKIPRVDLEFPYQSDLVEPISPELFGRYQAEVETVRPIPRRSDLKIVYTPIHGVGGLPVARLLTQGGHYGVIPVDQQFEPDGTFPTVSFPNPEEPGALDLAIATARANDADLIIANDPDADRLAAALPLAGEWRILTGNDLGCLLGDVVLRHHRSTTTPIVVSSIVSSPMLSRLADLYGARHEATLTGFKWIVNAGLAMEEAGEGQFVFGYEEALGYTVGKVVRDKDGMSAALVFCDLVAALAEAGETIWDRLVSLWEQVGVWASGQHTVSGGPGELKAAVERLGSNPPAEVAGMAVESVIDYREGAEGRPFWLGAQDLIELSLGSHGRVLVRPSGTEPKLKIYADLTEPISGDPLIQQGLLGGRCREVAKAVAEAIGL